jgi:hypothetical protein
MKYGFLDESGDVGYAEGSFHNLVVAIVVTDNPVRLRKVTTRQNKNWLTLGADSHRSCQRQA